ncbi:hypothetical protein GCM10018771_28360 [Streptomyces cellulosae]|nr:hypothetical protein GCM10018771_28360 [Streptomyces cellulosae]
MPAPAASRPPATIVTAAAFFRFFTFRALLATTAAIAAVRTGQRVARAGDTEPGCHSPYGMNLSPEGNLPVTSGAAVSR